MDKAKRQTLKRASGAVVASVVGSVLSRTASSASGNAISANPQPPLEDATGLSAIKVHTRISAKNNDLEVIIRNIGDKAARITQLTPSQATTARGIIDFSQLMEDGPLILASGESVSVPMKAHSACRINDTSCVTNARSLTESLRASFSVVTDYDSYAMVSVVDGLRFS